MDAGILTILYSLAAAASWGVGDFGGGLASRRNHVYTVILTGQGIGVVLIIALILVRGETIPSGEALIWGGIAGLFSAFGLITMYRSLARLPMGVVTPIIAVEMTAFPVVFAALVEGAPTSLQMGGFGLALVAVALISRSGGGAGGSLTLAQLREPLVSGVLFGGFLIALDRASSDSAVFIPLLAARAVSMSILFFLAWRAGVPRFPTRARLPLIALTGVMDVFGNTFYMLATQVGRLDIAAVISSLYPAVTVTLARLVLAERLHRWQFVGVAAALTAIVLITL
jgi:drug/metabolite transporter (DMT)-like permease